MRESLAQRLKAKKENDIRSDYESFEHSVFARSLLLRRSIFSGPFALVSVYFSMRWFTERILNILLPFCYPIRWQRTTQADIGWTGVAKIPKENRMLHNWPLRAEMAVAAFRVRCMSISRLERKRSGVWPTANQLRIARAIESANFEI